ncbi:MAG: exodeoxyribonuclease III [Gammaproteobacteria bacterium]|jgi:exodeoxyribonuclease-3|nr:exodeoxyribonuclease III [Gammaproteobacteria bacterium]|tara:strand:+ start:90 stop:866 length:777 start_codon:yes stop_codon:yes gene_type:complete
MKIITLNVNGIRASAKKGLFDWLKKEDPDLICLQEVRAQIEDIKDTIYWPENYHCFHHTAEKKGYSGVAIFSKKQPNKVTEGLGVKEFDNEGRYIECSFDNFSIASVYFPSGTTGTIRQDLKYRFLDQFSDLLKETIKNKKPYIFCGDVNIVHKEVDIKNWKANQKNSGCLPEERAWLDFIFDDLSCIDSFREVNQNEHEYTWWSNRGKAYQNNVGWRIDYQVITSHFEGSVLDSYVYKEQKFSDHAPLVNQYDYEFK